MGHSLTANADYVVVGYNNHDRVEVYNARTGVFLRTIVCPDGTGVLFNYEKGGMQIDGTRLIVGAFLARKAYIFDVSDGSLLRTLTSTKEQFGIAVSIKGNYAAVTSKYDSAATRDISVYDVTTGGELYTIDNPNVNTGSSGDSFAFPYIAMTSSYIVASALEEDEGGVINTGIVYIFDITDGALVCTRTDPDQLQFGAYSTGLSADGDRLALSRKINKVVEDGSTRTVSRAELHNISALISDPASAPYLVINDPSEGGLNGWDSLFSAGSLSLSGDYIAIGAYNRNLYPNGGTSGEIYTATQTGAAYLFNATDGTLVSTKLGTTDGELVGYEVAAAPGLFAWTSPNKNSQLGAVGFDSAEQTVAIHLQPDSTIATTAYVDSSVSNLIDSSPAALNTLNKLAAAIGDDANFSTTVTTSLASKADATATASSLAAKADATATTSSLAAKAPLVNPTFTGVPAAPTAALGTNTTQLATTAFVTDALGTVSSGADYEIGDGLEINNVTAVDWPASPDLISTINGSTAGKQLGFNIAASADYVVAGYYDHDRVEVYNARTGAFLRSIVCPNGSGKRFGKHGIDIDGTNLIVGAPGANKAYIFDITNGNTLQTFSSSSVEFGIHVSIKGNYAAVSDYHTSDSDWIGKLTVYNVTTGSQLYVVNNPNSGGGDSGDNFAKDGLDMTASYIVSAGWREDTGASGSGTAYVFDITNGALLATVLNPNPVSNGFFGYGIAADGDYLGVYGGVAGNSNVYVYSLSALVANASASPIYTVSNPSPDGNTGDNFGYASVSVAGTYMAVGAKAEDVGSGSSGSSYLYDLSDGTLLYSVSGASGDDYMGTASAVGVGVFVTGSPQNDSGGSNNGSIGIYNGTVSSTNYLQTDSTIATTASSITIATLKSEVAASADFAAFKARIAAL